MKYSRNVDYLICAYPKSATGLVSMALSLDPSCICYHDEVTNELEKKKKTFIVTGNASTGEYMLDATAQFDARIQRVWIERNSDDAKENARRYLVGTDMVHDIDGIWDRIQDRAEAWKSRWNPKIFQFEDIITKVGLLRLASHLGIPNIQTEKLDNLLRLNVSPLLSNYTG